MAFNKPVPTRVLISKGFAIFSILVEVYFNSFVSCQKLSFPNSSVGSCRMKSGRYGWCRDVRSCPPIATNISNAGESGCGFRGNIPLVCCPLYVDLFTKNSTDSKKALFKNAPAPNITFECGKFINKDLESTTKLERAFSGQDLSNSPDFSNKKSASVPTSNIESKGSSVGNHWPWMVLLGKRGNQSEELSCSGILISQKFVLTAAQCVLKFRDSMHVLLGERGPNSQVETEVTQVLFHPDYDGSKKRNNVALLEMAQPILFTKDVSPICLPWESFQDLINKEVIILGWRKSNNSSLAPVQVMTAIALDPSVCEKIYSKLPQYQLDEMPKGSFLCAKYEENSKHICEENYMESMTLINYRAEEDTYTLAGISIHDTCDQQNVPRIYTSLGNQQTLQWIKNVAF